jgi:hypothetical protein
MLQRAEVFAVKVSWYFMVLLYDQPENARAKVESPMFDVLTIHCQNSIVSSSSFALLDLCHNLWSYV